MQGLWLGQAGFIFRSDDGMTIMVDPYLSDALEKKHGPDYHRSIPVDPAFLFTPDVLVLTHCHDDHMDLETLDCLFAGKRMTVLAPASVFPVLRERYPQKAEYVIFTPGTEVTIGDVLFRSVFAAHSDPAAIGVVIECGGKRVYHMGDSLYHRDILCQAAPPVDLLILPINGKGNNMNTADAVRMAAALSPRKALPMHWDMFRAFGCDVSEFTARCPVETLLPEHYQYFEI